MWTIRRIRLDRIGTPAARFLDVTLDLTSPATGSPVDTILWLRNGGGKTTIMALVGALLRPARDEFLSATEGSRDGGRHIEDYLLGPDTGHVSVEWGEAGGRRLVTGAVYEWADRQPPADPARDHDRLNVGYYAFTPVPGRLEIERLPFAVAAGRTTLDAFLSHLRAHAATTDVVVTRKQSEWTKALDARRIDSDLWRTILAMNRSEGGIEAQFLFSSADDFARYLLRLITDPEEPDGVADLLRKVAARLVRRPDLLEELRFAREATQRLTELDVAYRDGTDARALLAIAEGQARELRSALRSGEAAARAAADAAERERGAAVLSRKDHDRDAEIARHTGFEYRRIAAVRRCDAVKDEITSLATRLVSARAAVDAWPVAPAVAAHDAAVERERTLGADFAEASAEAEPERLTYLAEAGRLGRALVDLAVSAEDGATKALADRGAARADAVSNGTELEAATARRIGLESRATELGRVHRALDDDLLRARADGLLGLDETASAGLARARTQDLAAASAEEAAKADIERLDGEIGTAAEARATARAELAETRAALAAATAARTELAALVGALAAEARLADLLGSDAIDPLAMAPNLLAALREAVAHARRELVDLGVAGAEDTRALAALESDEALLPPALDLVRALATLAAAKIPAVAGWSYIAALPPERRLATFLAAPALAGGALVADPADLGRAREILAEDGFAPTTIIGVGTTADLEAALPGETIAPFVIPANRALYDRERARDERTAREGAQANRATTQAVIEARHDADLGLAARIEHLVSTCPPDRLPGLDDQIARLAARRETLVDAIDRASTALAAGTAERTDAVRARGIAGTARLALASAIARVDALALREAAAAETRAEAAGLPDRIALERDGEAARRRDREAAAGRADDAFQHSLEMAETARGYRGQLAGLPGERIAPAGPDGRSLDVLVAAAAAARERYEARTSGSPLARQVDEARRERGRLELELAGKPAEVLAYARALKELPAKDAELYQRRQDRAARQYLKALRNLAVVRRLLVPTLQVNIARRQVNIAAAERVKVTPARRVRRSAGRPRRVGIADAAPGAPSDLA